MFRLLGFAAVTLPLAALLVLAGVAGGWWLAAALVWVSGLTLAMDRLIPAAAGTPAKEIGDQPVANLLPALLAILHFVLLILAISAIAGESGLMWWERVLAFAAFGTYFGQVSVPVAHELIHRQVPWLHELGKWIFISIAFGHHTSSHPKVHHRYVGTDDDPNSARAGTSFYRFAPKAWIGSFSRGLRLEIGNPAEQPWYQHPYATYIGGALGFMLLSLMLGGKAGLLAYVALAAFATMQLLLSDYVQHYGLRRATLDSGRVEPVGPQHAWNAPHWFSGRLMLNAPRHSDHHLHPLRPYPDLHLPGKTEAPTLPHSMPYMAVMALVPGRWKAVMDPLVTEWQMHGKWSDE